MTCEAEELLRYDGASVKVNDVDESVVSLPTGADADSFVREVLGGVRGNCLFEVEVDFFNSSQPSGHGPGDFNNSAIEIARVMMERVDALI